MLRINPISVQPMQNNQKSNAKNINFGSLNLKSTQQDLVTLFPQFHDLTKVIQEKLARNEITERSAKACTDKIKGIILISQDELVALNETTRSHQNFREEVSLLPHAINQDNYFSQTKHKPNDAMSMWDLSFCLTVQKFIKESTNVPDKLYKSIRSQMKSLGDKVLTKTES